MGLETVFQRNKLMKKVFGEDELFDYQHVSILGSSKVCPLWSSGQDLMERASS